MIVTRLCHIVNIIEVIWLAKVPQDRDLRKRVKHLSCPFEKAGVEVSPVYLMSSLWPRVLGLADLLLYAWLNFMFNKLAVVETMPVNY